MIESSMIHVRRSPIELLLILICCGFLSCDSSDIVFLVVTTASLAESARHALLGSF